MKTLLDVPYLSQFDDLDDVEWQDKACGIACLAMVMGYYDKKERNLKDLIALGVERGAHVAGEGWIHSELCTIANMHGYTAWRKKWLLSPADKKIFKEEGRTEADNKAYDEQTEQEGIYTIEASIRNSIPVMVSVDKEMCNTLASHLVVICGMEKDGEKLMGFYFHNPDTRGGSGKDTYVHLEKFKEHWNKRGIFVITR